MPKKKWLAAMAATLMLGAFTATTINPLVASATEATSCNDNPDPESMTASNDMVDDDCNDSSDDNECDDASMKTQSNSDESDDCTPPPPPPPADACPNIPGNQSEVPADNIVDSNGDCVPPPVVYTPAITASGVCVNDHVATISGQTSGFPDGAVLLFAQRGDLDFGANTGTANSAYSFPVDVYNDLGPQTGSLSFDGIFAQQGVYSVSVAIVVDFSKCQPAPPTTQPPATTTPPTTAPPTTAPTTTQPAPSTVATGQPPVPPTGTLPKTGTGTTVGGIIIGLVALLLGLGLVRITRRRPLLS
jgi:LPXTG-motif cell wall-anchored protein